MNQGLLSPAEGLRVHLYTYVNFPAETNKSRVAILCREVEGTFYLLFEFFLRKQMNQGCNFQFIIWLCQFCSCPLTKLLAIRFECTKRLSNFSFLWNLASFCLEIIQKAQRDFEGA